MEFGSSWQVDDYRHFELIETEKSKYVVRSGDPLYLKGKVKNNDPKISTCYVVERLASPYDHQNFVFNSDTDLSENIKGTLRIVDVKPKGKKDFYIAIPIPETMPNCVLDLQIELWSPARLYHKIAPIHTIALFDRTPFKSIVEVVSSKERPIATVFVSYSWKSRKHMKWVSCLCEELNRHNIKSLLDQKDLMPGQEITAFMERGAGKLPICVAICSDVYTKKADNREEQKSGVKYEVSILTAAILGRRLPALVIPVVKDNPEKILPLFLGSALFIDMDVKDWKEEPLNSLVNAIIRGSKKNS